MAPPAVMAIPASSRSFRAGPTNKRKRQLDQPSALPNKKHHTGPSRAQIPQGLPLEPHEPFLAELRAKYDVLPLSVISSSKVEKRVTRLLEHLSQFHPSNMSVLPGVVLVHARAAEAAKLVSVVEIVKVRVHESGQKWFQYNRVYDVERELREDEEMPSVIENTVMNANDGSGQAADEDNDSDISDESAFEPMPARFADAITNRPKTVPQSYLSVFLSRVPIQELHSKDCFTLQTNGAQIEQQQQKKLGLA